MESFFDDIEDVMIEKCNNDSNYKSFYTYDIPRIKESVEELWSVFKNYAPKDFKQKMIESTDTFKQRWWEMYLTVKLIQKGFYVETNHKDCGPDIKIVHEGITYWIEAVVSMRGDKSEFVVPKFEVKEELTVEPMPRDLILLRIANSLSYKNLKFQKYKEKNIVNDGDKLIIAINTFGLGQYGSLMDFPQLAIDTILYNEGNLVINLKTGEKHIKDKNGINKGSNVIDTNFFDNNEIIDGVIYSHDEPLNMNNKIYLREPKNKLLPDNFRKEFLIEK